MKISMKKTTWILALGFVFFIFSCVGPPEPQHGLVENYSVVVNADSVFTFAVRGEVYSFEETYDLNLKLSNGMKITSALIVADYTGSTQDTSQIWLLNDQGIVQKTWVINKSQTLVEQRTVDSVYYFPEKIMVKGNQFSGVLEFVLTAESSSGTIEENVPAVITTESIFSFSLKAAHYTFDRFYPLSMDYIDLTSITLTDWIDVGEDTTFVTLYSADTTEMVSYELLGNTQITEETAVDSLFQPKFIGIAGQNLTGVFDVLLMKN